MPKEHYCKKTDSDNSPVLLSHAVSITFEEKESFCMKISLTCIQIDVLEINIRHRETNIRSKAIKAGIQKPDCQLRDRIRQLFFIFY